jgi:hypothetical protein
MDRPQLREPIDACRVTGDDLCLPELALLAEQIDGDPEVREIFQRAQRLDLRISRAMHEVALPAGLCDRILMRLEAEQPAETITNLISAQIATEDEPEPRRDQSGAVHREIHSRPVHRRQWLVSLAAIAALLLVGLGLWRLWPHGSPLSVKALLASGGQWHDQLGNAAWKPLAPGQGLKDFPLAAVVLAAPRGWADVSALAGRPAVAYDLNVGRGRRATLFVINEPNTAADSAPPRIPGSNTGGLTIGVWKADGLVYVLVVEGDQRRYDRLLDKSGQPLA